MALHIPATRPSLDKIICSNDALGCVRPVLAKGLCARCYQRRANGIPMDSLDRHPRGTAFDDRYEATPSGCYEWTAGRFSSGGYGEFYVKGRGMVRATATPGSVSMARSPKGCSSVTVAITRPVSG